MADQEQCEAAPQDGQAPVERLTALLERSAMLAAERCVALLESDRLGNTCSDAAALLNAAATAFDVLRLGQRRPRGPC